MKACKKICGQCPFHKNSIPSWLGPHTVKNIIAMQRDDYPFTCHLKRIDNQTEEDAINGNVHICRGYIASASKSAKLFKNNLSNLQKEIKKEEKDKVLSIWEFKTYHTNDF